MNDFYVNDREDNQLIMDLLQTLRQKLALILLITMISALGAWLVSSFFITPKYEASVNMIVNTRAESGGSITNDNISSAKNLVNTYAIIIKSNTVLNRTIERLQLDTKYDNLYNRVTVEAINNTQVMKIAVQDPDPEVAKAIVETIAQIAPAVVTEAVEAGSCKVVSMVDVSEKPVTPDVPKITILAGLLGLLVTAAVVVLNEILHDQIVDDHDVERKLGIPVLGIVPDIEEGME